MDAFQCACEALAAELRATQLGLDVGLDESASAGLSAGLHSLLRVPGVASVVGRAVRRAEYDLLKARLVTLARVAKQQVLHPLLSKELDRLTLVELQNSDDNFEVSIAGGIDSIDETRGAELRLHEYDLQKLDPPVVARLEWSEDPDSSFERTVDPSCGEYASGWSNSSETTTVSVTPCATLACLSSGARPVNECWLVLTTCKEGGRRLVPSSTPWSTGSAATCLGLCPCPRWSCVTFSSTLSSRGQHEPRAAAPRATAEQ